MHSRSAATRLEQMVRSTGWLMRALVAAREVAAPDWLIGAGAVRTALPSIPWDAKNQAAVHLWYPGRFGYEVPPLASSAHGVGTWPETATAVGLRLSDDDRLHVEAPCGLDDLLGMVNRRNPRRVSVEEYERRLASKRIAERWPRVTVVPARQGD